MPDLKATEWDLLDALWVLERATARQVAEHLQERRGWAYSTVKTLLDRLVKRDLVAARKVGNVWEYSAILQRAHAQRGAWRSFVDVAFGGAMGSALNFVQGQGSLTADQRESLSALIDESEREEQ